MIAQGSLLGARYKVREELGRGAFSVVHAAWDRRLEREVAVKWLTVPRERERGRLLAEAHAAGQLLHPHIVRVYDLGEHEALPYVVMEHLPGETLADE